MKKIRKIIASLCLLMIYLVCINYNVANAKAPFQPATPSGVNEPTPTISGTIKDVSPSYIDSSNYTELQTTIGYVLGFLQIASGLTAVIMIAFTGFKLIFEVNPKVVEETKKTMFPIVFGIVLTFGAVSIAKFIIGAVE